VVVPTIGSRREEREEREERKEREEREERRDVREENRKARRGFLLILFNILSGLETPVSKKIAQSLRSAYE